VKSHTRAGRAPARKARAPKAGATYYVVQNERTGKTLGTRHRTLTGAVAARKRADRASYRAGRGRPWNVAKRTG
jgi:hypothetical protein